MVMKMPKKLILTRLEVIAKANEYLDTKPLISIENDGSKTSELKNPEGSFYSGEYDVFVYERYAQIKFRVNDDMLEYQLSMMPWSMSAFMNIWNDAPKAKSSIVEMRISRFDEPGDTWSAEELEEARKLMYRMYEYYKIVPCAQEQ